MNAENEESKTALHYACEKGDKEAILLLVMSGIDVDKKNKSNQKAGDTQMDAKMLINNIICEKACFNVLTQPHKNKLLEIF